MASCVEKTSLPYYNTADFEPLFDVSKAELKDVVPHQIGSFTMINQKGETVSQETVEGKIHLATFIFTGCASICPVMTKNIKKVYTHFLDEPNVVLLSFSVTPWKDSVANLRRFAANYDVQGPNWHFITGKKAEIYNLARRSYFAEEDLGFSKDSTDFLHTEHVLLIDSDKRIRGIYNGTLELEIDQAIEDIELLLHEQF